MGTEVGAEQENRSFSGLQTLWRKQRSSRPRPVRVGLGLRLPTPHP